MKCKCGREISMGARIAGKTMCPTCEATQHKAFAQAAAGEADHEAFEIRKGIRAGLEVVNRCQSIDDIDEAASVNAHNPEFADLQGLSLKVAREYVLMEYERAIGRA